jgi:hypothetical protein
MVTKKQKQSWDEERQALLVFANFLLGFDLVERMSSADQADYERMFAWASRLLQADDVSEASRFVVGAVFNFLSECPYGHVFKVALVEEDEEERVVV